MALELRDCTFNGPALPEPFVKFQLERELSKRNLLAKTTGAEGRALEDRWDVFRRKLRQLGVSRVNPLGRLASIKLAGEGC